MGTVLWLAWQAGGYFAPSRLTAGAIVFVTLGAILIVRPPHYPIGTAGALAVAALGGLAAWSWVSLTWSAAPDNGLENVQLGLLYLGLFGLGLLSAGSGRLAAPLVWLVLAAAAVIVGAGVVSRLRPDLLASTPDPLSVHRLAYPLGYWNAYGAMAATGGVLALGLAAEPRARPWARGLAAGGVVVFGAGMYLSLSRGAWLAAVPGLVLLLVLTPRRGALLVSAGVAGGAASLAILGLSRHGALVDDPRSGVGQLAAGHAFTLRVLELIVLAGALQFGIATLPSDRALVRVRAALRSLALPLAGVTLVIVALAYAVLGGRLERGASRATTSTAHWIDRQWSDFLHPTEFAAGGRERLKSAKGSRSDLYRVAFDGFEAHPLRGDGAGAFPVRWTRDRRVEETVRNAHSLYLETLGELGVPGGLLLLGFLVAVGTAAAQSMRRPTGLSRPQTAAVAAAVATWLVHAALDWDWQVPALSGVGLLLAATLFPRPRRARRSRRKRHQERNALLPWRPASLGGSSQPSPDIAGAPMGPSSSRHV